MIYLRWLYISGCMLGMLQEGQAIAAQPSLCEASAHSLERTEDSGHSGGLPQRNIWSWVFVSIMWGHVHSFFCGQFSWIVGSCSFMLGSIFNHVLSMSVSESIVFISFDSWKGCGLVSRYFLVNLQFPRTLISINFQNLGFIRVWPAVLFVWQFPTTTFQPKGGISLLSSGALGAGLTRFDGELPIFSMIQPSKRQRKSQYNVHPHDLFQAFDQHLRCFTICQDPIENPQLRYATYALVLHPQCLM